MDMSWFSQQFLNLPIWAWLLIALVLVILIIVIVAVAVKSKKKSEAVQEQAEEQPLAVQEEKTEEHHAEPVKEEKKVEKKTEPAKTTENKSAAKTTEKKPVATTAAKVENKPAEKKGPVKVYHISLRKADGMWQVKAAGAEKAIKLFKTQAEAIEFCKPLAENQEANIVIHKKDGSFRKLTY